MRTISLITYCSQGCLCRSVTNSRDGRRKIVFAISLCRCYVRSGTEIIMSGKKFMPCLYLYRNQAVKSSVDKTIVELDPIRLTEQFVDARCDCIYVQDLSENDKEHDEAVDVIRELCSHSLIPVIGGGHLLRMEDVTKLFYAGCCKVTVNLENGAETALFEEVSLKFGKDRIVAGVDSPAKIQEYREAIEKYASEVYLFHAGGSGEAALTSPVPVTVFLPEVSLEKLIEVLSYANISGVSGRLVNENLKEVTALRKLCADETGQEESEKILPFSALKTGPDGLVPVVVQDVKTDAVLMVAYMDEHAYEQTLETGRMTYFSRSRQQLWVKGEMSGHFQQLHSLTADCDLDTLLAKVTQEGAACHTGAYSCFFNEIADLGGKEEQYNPLKVFEEVYDIIRDRKEHPKEGSYTNYLFDKGLDKILKKVGEEATEIVIAAKNPNPNEVKYEIADFLYHMMVLMAQKGIDWEEITEELAKR